MFKRPSLVTLLSLVLLATSIFPVVAQGPIPDVYVDERRTDGNEDGSAEYPYNTVAEGRAWAQSLPSGARVRITYLDGKTDVERVNPCFTGAQGTPFPQVLIAVLLALFAGMLVFVGWRLRKRAVHLED